MGYDYSEGNLAKFYVRNIICYQFISKLIENWKLSGIFY